MDKRRISLIGLGVALALFFALNMASAALFRTSRLDLTENGLYTLSRGTRNILDAMTEPVTLRFYFSGQLATDFPELKGYAQRVEELLAEFAGHSNGKIELFVADPEPFSEEEDRAVGFGLQGAPVNAAGEILYFGLAGTNSTDDEETIPFFQTQREEFLEYDLAKLVYTLAFPQRKVVGLLSTLPLEGGRFNPMNPREVPQPWFVVDQIRQLFELRSLSTSLLAIPEDVDILVLVHPQALSDELLYALDQFVLRGGKLIAFVDPHCEAQPVPQDPSNQLAAFTADRASDLGPLLAAWGVELVKEKIIGDRLNAQRVMAGQRPVEYVAWLGLDQGETSRDDPVTSDLSRINMATAGRLNALSGATTTFTPMIQTSDEAMEIERMQVAFQPDPEGLLRGYLPGGERFTLAARISGPAKSAFPGGAPQAAEDDAGDGAQGDEESEASDPEPKHLAESQGDINVVLVADADMLEDRQWVQIQNFLGQRIAIPSANNADFLINAIDNLSGSDDLISLRSRARFNRPFERVAAIRRRAEERYRNEEQVLEERLRETERKINDLQMQKEGAVGALILTPEQRAAVEKFRAERIETRKKLRDVKHQLRKDIERLGVWLKAVNIGLIPAAIAIVAMALGVYRVKRNR